jgi:hypothetical protein
MELSESVLDEIGEIKKIDKSNMLSFCVEAPKHYREAARIGEKISLAYSKPANIIVAGMGGSAIGGELLKDWARDKVNLPIEVNREYSVTYERNRGEAAESEAQNRPSARNLRERGEIFAMPGRRKPTDEFEC